VILVFACIGYSIRLAIQEREMISFSPNFLCFRVSKSAIAFFTDKAPVFPPERQPPVTRVSGSCYPSFRTMMINISLHAMGGGLTVPACIARKISIMFFYITPEVTILVKNLASRFALGQISKFLFGFA
jgi:hypothetical protein